MRDIRLHGCEAILHGAEETWVRNGDMLEGDSSAIWLELPANSFIFVDEICAGLDIGSEVSRRLGCELFYLLECKSYRVAYGTPGLLLTVGKPTCPTLSICAFAQL